MKYNLCVNRLPEKLVSLRKHYNYSQEEIADLLQIDVTDYMGIENGRRVLNYDQIICLSKFYKIKFDELFVNEYEVTLHEIKGTTTDQINIDYFLNQNKWYRRLYRKVQSSFILKMALIVFVLCCALFVGSKIIEITKPLEFDENSLYKLAVSEKTVSYLNDGRLQTTGSMNISGQDIVSVQTGNNFVLELKNDGTVYCEGLNEDKTREIDRLKDIVYITSCDNHIIAIDKNDNIKTIGENENGELDISKWRNISNIKTFKTGTIGIDDKGYLVYAGDIVGRSQFKLYKNCIDYDANEYMTVVVKNDNTVDYSAYNDHYTSVIGWNDITSICCGKEFIAGLKKDGTVLISCLDETMTKEVETWKNIKAIDSAEDYLIAYDGDSIFGVGENNYNQFEKKQEEKITLKQIDTENLNVEIKKDEVTVVFAPVENAYAYEVTMIADKTITYEIEAGEKVVFSNLDLEEGKFYSIRITSLGKDKYVSSAAFEYTFEFKETKK